MRKRRDELAVRALVDALADNALAVHPYIRDGRRYVHVAPPHAPTAGTDVLCTPTGSYVSEWGSGIGDLAHATAVACHLLYLFGRARP
jgi:hypothetical protein